MFIQSYETQRSKIRSLKSHYSGESRIVASRNAAIFSVCVCVVVIWLFGSFGAQGAHLSKQSHQQFYD